MGLCKQVIYETHVGKAFQAGAVCHRAMTLTLQSSIAICQQKPEATHDDISIHKKHQILLDTTRCDDTRVIAGMLFCGWVQADTIVPLSHLVM